MTHASWALQSYDLSGEGINSGSHTLLITMNWIITHLGKNLKNGAKPPNESTRAWWASPDEGSASMPGPSPRQHKRERQYTPSTHPFILTRRIWKDDYDGQMIFGDLVGLKHPDLFYSWGKTTNKNSPRKLVPTGNRTRSRCVRDFIMAQDETSRHHWL